MGIDKTQRSKRSRPFLRLDDVTLKSSTGLAFHKTNWVWERGQHWAMIGPNGSGKSLLAWALAGQVPVVRGEIEYGFSGPSGRSTEHAIAFVSFMQSRELGLDGPPALRWFSLEHLDMPSVQEFLSRERVEEINPFEVDGPARRSPLIFDRDRRRVLKLMQIEHLVGRDMLALSNGERRKVLIARALLKNPRLLILDEPSAGLDVASRRHLNYIITELISEAKVHVLILTMRQEELPPGITHELHIARQRIQASGPRRKQRAYVSGSDVAVTSPPFHSRRFARRPAKTTRVRAPVIQLSKVNVSYGDRVILDDMSWTVGYGDSWAILGPNGSGKTTLLGLITGDNPQAYANDVMVFGKRRGEEESLWALRRKIGVVSPDELLSVDGSLTCEDVVCPGMDDPEQDEPTNKQRKAARLWLRWSGLEKLASECFGSLSLDQQFGVLLARALAKEPGILVLDEPCQGLDAVHRQRFIRSVEAVMKHSALTVLYVTHHRDEMPRGISQTLKLPVV
jgi:molybdate transport system ATP-binding protein